MASTASRRRSKHNTIIAKRDEQFVSLAPTKRIASRRERGNVEQWLDAQQQTTLSASRRRACGGERARTGSADDQLRHLSRARAAAGSHGRVSSPLLLRLPAPLGREGEQLPAVQAALSFPAARRCTCADDAASVPHNPPFGGAALDARRRARRRRARAHYGARPILSARRLVGTSNCGCCALGFFLAQRRNDKKTDLHRATLSRARATHRARTRSAKRSPTFRCCALHSATPMRWPANGWLRFVRECLLPRTPLTRQCAAAAVAASRAAHEHAGAQFACRCRSAAAAATAGAVGIGVDATVARQQSVDGSFALPSCANDHRLDRRRR